MKPNIIIVIPRGEAIRNFIYSGIIRRLRNSYHVIVVSIKPNEKIWQLLMDNSDELIELKHEKRKYLFRILYDLLDLAHNKYLWSEAAKVRWKMRDVEAKSLRQKSFRIIKKNIAKLMANANILQKTNTLLNSIAYKEEVVKKWDNLFENHKIDLIFNTSHSHSRIATPVVYAAKKKGVKTATFLFSWDNLTSQGRIIPDYQYYFAWNSKIKQDLLRIYPEIDKNNVFVTGTPQFINHFNEKTILSKEKLYKFLNLEKNQKYFLYSSGMSHHMPHEPYVVERIADIIHKIDPSIKLVVRTYAKDRFDVFDDLKSRRKDIIIPDVQWESNFQTPLLEDHAVYVSMLKNCIAGINVASTVTLELCMLDKPAINVGYNPPNKDIFPYNYTRFYNFDHYKPIVESGAIDLARNEKEMEQYLRDAINNPEKKKKERKQLIDSFFEEKLGSEVIENFNNAFDKIINNGK